MSFPFLKKPVHSLLLLSGICCIMLVRRLIAAQEWEYAFMGWNLFLAWVPLLIVLFLQKRQIVHPTKRVFTFAGLLLWLLFLPNAPYMITDLMHLRYRDGVPLWYDSLMVFSFATAGMHVGLYSLMLAHRLLEQLLGRAWSWLLVTASLGLTGFGVYLGRFSRWNSWDLFVQPHHLFADALRQLYNPTALKLTLAFTLVLGLCYFAFLSFVHSQSISHESAQ